MELILGNAYKSLRGYTCSLIPENAERGLHGAEKVLSSPILPEHHYILAVSDCYRMLNIDLSDREISALINLGYLTKIIDLFKHNPMKEINPNAPFRKKTIQNNIGEYAAIELGYWLSKTKIYFPQMVFREDASSLKKVFEAVKKAAFSRFNPDTYTEYLQEIDKSGKEPFRFIKLMTRYLIISDMRHGTISFTNDQILHRRLQDDYIQKREDETYDCVESAISLLERLNWAMDYSVANSESSITNPFLEEREHQLTIDLADHLVSFFK